MPDYAGKWKTAKKTFGTNTGKKKPKATKQGLFDKTTSKKSGVADLLKAVDKLITGNFLEPVSDKHIDNLNKAVNAI